MFQVALRNKSIIEMFYLIVSQLYSVHRITGLTSPISVNLMQFMRSRITAYSMRKFYLRPAFVTRC